MTFFIIVAIVAVITIRIALRKKGVTDMQLKPYRYQVETRRSPWANRGGF